ncbi:archaeosortase A [Salarchaeum sp. JOR-1]|uniref:archaeosortase A n=1 Tax=Salarchaeum sp. JOR-1 TaxID=2599399 RepID=UPI00119873F1|nr:archaeosortase A [Salarchaeum sp. JOR-1]QDX39961.1 archaeosortase A [Salarchaeum sp. JOR-1]
MSLALTDTLAWVVVAAFALSALLGARDDEHPARVAAAAAWAVFAVFWALLIDHFLFSQNSYIEGLLAALAVPLSLYAAYLVLTDRPRLVRLSRAIAVMGLLYLPFQTIPALTEAAITITAESTYFLITLVGYSPQFVTDPYPSAVVFVHDGVPITTNILLACSGIGSIAIVSGLIAATTAPIRRRLTAISLVVPLIYLLNVVRVSFIAIAFGNQWFQWTRPLVTALYAPLRSEPRISYLFADKILAQSLSVAALVLITLGLLRIIPELAALLDDALYVATKTDYDLENRLTR